MLGYAVATHPVNSSTLSRCLPWPSPLAVQPPEFPDLRVSSELAPASLWAANLDMCYVQCSSSCGLGLTSPGRFPAAVFCALVTDTFVW